MRLSNSTMPSLAREPAAASLRPVAGHVVRLSRLAPFVTAAALLGCGMLAGRAAERGGSSIAAAALVHTAAAGPINKLAWQTEPAAIRGDGTLAAPRPQTPPRVFFFTATTADGLTVSSPAVIVPER